MGHRDSAFHEDDGACVRRSAEGAVATEVRGDGVGADLRHAVEVGALARERSLSSLAGRLCGLEPALELLIYGGRLHLGKGRGAMKV